MLMTLPIFKLKVKSQALTWWDTAEQKIGGKLF